MLALYSSLRIRLETSFSQSQKLCSDFGTSGDSITESRGRRVAVGLHRCAHS